MTAQSLPRGPPPALQTPALPPRSRLSQVKTSSRGMRGTVARTSSNTYEVIWLRESCKRAGSVGGGGWGGAIPLGLCRDSGSRQGRLDALAGAGQSSVA